MRHPPHRLRPGRPLTTALGIVIVACVAVCGRLERGGSGSDAADAPSAEVSSPVRSVVTLEPTGPALGDPLPGLTESELASFERGRLQFLRRWKPSEGLGPFYNATSCTSCHSTPMPGGSSKLYRNFYIAVWESPIGQNKLPGLPSVVLPAYGSGDQATSAFDLEGGRKILPETFFGNPVISEQRNAPPMFGVGLFEFVPDVEIISRADPDDTNGDGISGRFNTDFGFIGRFGYKAQANNIEFFTRPPLLNQMGITSDPFLGSAGAASLNAALQGTNDQDHPLFDADGIPDPEISREELGDLIAFSRLLAPPRPRRFDDAALRGEALFARIGCSACHVPALQSSRGPVAAYTDLLLHDMGPELADGLSFGMPQLSATTPSHTKDEWRTTPLWGVSMTAPYLHDGRAPSLHEAIVAHGGEAQQARDIYVNLVDGDREDIISFLEHL